jgi:ATP-dependent Clp protease ATP-binding subunit ClpC
VHFDSFTTQGRQVVGGAQRLACRSGHHLTGTGHLLLGLTGHQGSVAMQILEALGVNRDVIRAEVATRIGWGSASISRCPPFTMHASDALAYFEAYERRFRPSRIGPEHLFFALLADRHTTAAVALRGVGLDLNVARQRVLPLLACSLRCPGAEDHDRSSIRAG